MYDGADRKVDGDGIVATQNDRNVITLRAIAPLSLFAAVGYTVTALAHIATLPDDIKVPLALCAILTALVATIIFAVVQMDWLTRNGANVVMMIYTVAILGNSVAHLILSGEPHQAVNIGLTMICLGLFHLSIRYLLASFALVFIAWFWVVVPTFSTHDAVHYGFFLFTSTLITLIAFVVRWRTHNGIIIAEKRADAREVELKAAISRARLAEDAASNERAKNEFLANMSHELRTPLNAIIGFSDVLQREMFGDLGSAENKEYIGEIHSAGKSLLNILNDILDLAAVSMDNFDADYQLFSLQDVAQRCVGIVEARERGSEVSISVSVAPDVQEIDCDERCIKQVLVHLLSNAVKFNANGGWVRLTAGKAIDGRVFIRIADSGIGMNAHEIESALKPFWQSEGHLSRNKGGTGIGLAIAHETVSRLGGSLDIQSTPGNGTTVTIWLPPETRPEAAAAPGATDLPDGNRYAELKLNVPASSGQQLSAIRNG